MVPAWFLSGSTPLQPPQRNAGIGYQNACVLERPLALSRGEGDPKGRVWDFRHLQRCTATNWVEKTGKAYI